MMKELKGWFFELGILALIAAGFFLIFIIWYQVASAEPLLEEIYYFYEDDRYFARVSWTPEIFNNIDIGIENLGLIKTEIGIWLN